MARHLDQARPRAALVATALLSVGALTACGFDYATDQVYNSSTGTNHRTGLVDVLSAVVVSSSEGQGTFIATFNNNSLEDPETVTSLAGGTTPPAVTISGFVPLDLAPGAFINIADSERIKVTGDFSAGQYVDIVMDLQSAETIEMEVPVVSATDEYEGLDTTAEEPTAEPSSEAPTDAPTSAEASASPVE